MDFLFARIRTAAALLLVLALPPQLGAAPRTGKTSPPAEKSDKATVPLVEVFVPSIAKLSEQARVSHSGRLAAAFSGMFPVKEAASDEEFDAAALLSLLREVGKWPDTSVAFTTYTQDREGRPRWALQLDWPVKDLRERVESLLSRDASQKLFKDVRVRRNDVGVWQIELPDLVLAVMLESGDGCLLASSVEIRPPEQIFGKKQSSGEKGGSLVYCLLNLGAGEEKDRGRSMLGAIVGVSDIRYAGSVTPEGLWKERFNLRWNPLLGVAIGGMLKKTKAPFQCPKEAFACAAVHSDLINGMADSIAGLEVPTIGTRAGGEMAVSVLPGTGFLPLPDVYFQFHSRGRNSIVKAIRRSIEKDTRRRREDDRPAAWHETRVDGELVFWRDPSVDQMSGFSMMNYRTVVFFDGEEKSENKPPLVIAQTSVWADDAVRRWKKLRSKESAWRSVPDDSKVSWEGIIDWKNLYATLQPYLSLSATGDPDSEPPPPVEKVEKLLTPSRLAMKVEKGALDVRHTGPIPMGAGFIPLVAAQSLSAAGDWSSESQRERTACKNLRVLHHHARLFKKDYGRWPATVAELDGYVDFGSHPELLNLQRRDRGMIAGMVVAFTAAREGREDDGAVDDSLYVIESPETDWRLRFRDGEFDDYETIYIDEAGEIHRLARSGGHSSDKTKSAD